MTSETATERAARICKDLEITLRLELGAVSGLDQSDQIESVVLLQQSAADVVRILEECLCRTVPDPTRRTSEQHHAIALARRFYNTLVAGGDIRNAAGLATRAAAVARVMGRLPFVAPAPRTGPEPAEQTDF